jgi:8-oxo-dGTP pyrophosphatase MutT (NUDIX family)
MAVRDSAYTEYLGRLRGALVDPVKVALPSAESQRRAAAVLVPLIERDGDIHIIYTRRSDRLSSHRGQVAFPGGRFDQRDSDLLAAALRETHEEVGIEPKAVEVLGSFEGRATHATNIFVTPFVGLVHQPIELRPDPKEVAEIFEVPLIALHDNNYRGHHEWAIDGSTMRQPAILYGGQTIWGLTYQFTLRFLELAGHHPRVVQDRTVIYDLANSSSK